MTRVGHERPARDARETDAHTPSDETARSGEAVPLLYDPGVVTPPGGSGGSQSGAALKGRATGVAAVGVRVDSGGPAPPPSKLPPPRLRRENRGMTYRMLDILAVAIGE